MWLSGLRGPQTRARCAPSPIAPTGSTTPPTGPGNAVQQVLGFLSGTFTSQTQLTLAQPLRHGCRAYLPGAAGRNRAQSLIALAHGAVGQVAQFLVGGEIPVTETTTTGTSLSVFNSVTFLQYGVTLDVRPLVGDDDALTLDVLPQITTPDTATTVSIRESTGTNPPTTALLSRFMRTSARLQDGEGLMIGGLLSHTTNDAQASTPGLRDIPGLGWLFKNLNRTDDTQDLVVVVNPVIVRDPQPGSRTMGVSRDLRNHAGFREGPAARPAGSGKEMKCASVSRLPARLFRGRRHPGRGSGNDVPNSTQT